MRVVPGTNHTPKLPQRETYAPDNMLSRGQEIAVEVDEARAVDLSLHAGEMSLQHIGIVHGSGPNHSDHARIGLAALPARSERGRTMNLQNTGSPGRAHCGYSAAGAYTPIEVRSTTCPVGVR